MKKLENISFSLVDYEGQLTKFKREGEGKQQWGNFCTLSGEWFNNQLTKEAQLEFKYFPLQAKLMIDKKRINSAKFNLDQMKFDVMFDQNFSIQSGIIEVDEGMVSIHFTLNSQGIESFEFLRNNQMLEIEKHKESQDLYRIYCNDKKNKYIDVNMQVHTITLFKQGSTSMISGIIPQFNAQNQNFSIFNYETDKRIGQQMKLNLSQNNPFVCIYYQGVNNYIDRYYYADGTEIFKPSNEIKGKMTFQNNNTYVIGNVIDDMMHGQCKLVLDGKYEEQVVFDQGKLLIENPGRFLNKIDDLIRNNPQELEPNKLNGLQKFQYKNGISYTGYFINDFIYCHKDGLLSSLEGLQKERKFDLEEFLKRIKKFEGTIYEGKVVDQAYIIYNSGEVYKGQLDENFMKQGNGIELKPGKETKLYHGAFKKNLYHGLGKIFKSESEFTLGYFEEGKLLLQFDIDNMDVNIYEQIKNQLSKEIENVDENLLEKIFRELQEQEGGSDIPHDKSTNLQEMLKLKQAKKKQAEQEILNNLRQEVEMETIFHFNNGFAFHGRMLGQQIVNDSQGIIMIHSTQENIEVIYKYIPQLQCGSFKSKDGKNLFLFKYSEKKLSHIQLEVEEEKKEPIHQTKQDLLQKIKQNIKNIDEEQKEDSSIDLNEKLNDNVFFTNNITVATIATLLYLNSEKQEKHYLELIAEEINNSNLTWKANPNPGKRFINEERMFNLIIDPTPENFDEPPQYDLQLEDLPENFDSREQWPNCQSIKEVRDQSSCGSCWAFGAAEAMSDRLCIASNQQNQQRISTEDLMECCNECGYGCSGGYLRQSWSYWKSTGITTGGLYNDNTTCKPYAFPPCSHHVDSEKYESCDKHHYTEPDCKRQCSSDTYEKQYNDDKIYAKTSYNVYGEQRMLKELVTNGPFEVAIEVYSDFLTYKSGVYQRHAGHFMGGHAVKVLGYGVEDGVKYWLCANSWNEEWGDKGFFKLRRGRDECGIESQGVAGLPDESTF